MKNLLFISILLALFSCHKDNSTPTTTPAVSQPTPSKPDTFSVFFKATNWKKQIYSPVPQYYFLSIDSLNFKDTLYSPPVADFKNLNELDSALLFVFNGSWKRLHAGIMLGYPNDTLEFDAYGSGQNPIIAQNEGTCYVTLDYITSYFYKNAMNDTVPSNTNMQFKVFMKPLSSTIQP